MEVYSNLQTKLLPSCVNGLFGASKILDPEGTGCISLEAMIKEIIKALFNKECCKEEYGSIFCLIKHSWNQWC